MIEGTGNIDVREGKSHGNVAAKIPWERKRKELLSQDLEGLKEFAIKLRFRSSFFPALLSLIFDIKASFQK